jgi:hypothetical protein
MIRILAVRARWKHAAVGSARDHRALRARVVGAQTVRASERWLLVGLRLSRLVVVLMRE